LKAASEIGKEAAWAFTETGCRAVLFADVDESGATSAAEESKRYATHASYRGPSLVVDVASFESVQKMVDECIRRFGKIDYFVNSAGVRIA
jgi:NAD(P)-dependent dehydrogenase (short-subunit alcohol dehydrogenase family)